LLERFCSCRGRRISVLDIGGGDGQLAQFLPGADYFLAEPSVNGISGCELPFADGTFDYVVACHVLEHVMPNQRYRFLDNLVRRARRAVVLLNPFHDARTSVEERLHLFIRITNAQWAKEHLECSLPKLQTVVQYAADRGLRLDYEPNGFMPLSTALVFTRYFSFGPLRAKEFALINEYFNVRLSGLLNSEDCPNAYLITLETH